MAHATKFALLGLTLMLAACRSDPIHYHTLIPQQPVPVNSVDVQLELISVPPQVDRPQLVIRQSNSSLAILETEWWGASLADELQNALINQFSSNSAQPGLGLRVDIQRFDSVPGQYALFDARWRLRAAGGSDAGALNCRSVIQTPAGPTIEELVVAHQQNIKRFTEQVSQAARGGANRCPTP
ncbi:membrane integrity-associated transporter subunit PqiC [Pseudomonas sp. JQ170]|uniref:PqiC family protein n=1 Tax=unclassified Pseudomonas TaxID=196821 RepID=UPI00264FD36E|nr:MULTISPECIES: PqiC family protein [unclassified Pseudomonas]MDN7143453.1 membrane integrity-associated transporter subunit PqiC [Pseudomonas sp. JQ170]WRO73906.1 PqiC family protein [Pseudomonas sp. 170C]